ncbi:MAG: transporter [Ilumatobacteraceae bacterium]|nr:transporter [Ilumatobacteraceae bacterium]
MTAAADAVSTTGTPAAPARAGVLALGLGRTCVELKNLWRSKQALGFTVLFPVMMLLLFASIFHGDIDHTTVKISQVYVAGIIGSALMSTGFVGLAIGLATERDAGMLKRLASTPMPKAAYFLGKIGMVLATVLLQVVVLVALGVAFFHVHLPSGAGRWLTFVWVFVLGVTAATLLGIAIGGVIRDAKSAPAVVNLPFIALQFISGVWITVTQLPSWLLNVARIFPLFWICQGMRSVFLPDGFLVVEPGHTWNHATGALVLAAWCVIGFVLCMRTFRWTRERQ